MTDPAVNPAIRNHARFIRVPLTTRASIPPNRVARWSCQNVSIGVRKIPMVENGSRARSRFPQGYRVVELFSVRAWGSGAESGYAGPYAHVWADYQQLGRVELKGSEVSVSVVGAVSNLTRLRRCVLALQQGVFHSDHRFKHQSLSIIVMCQKPPWHR
jgi:hypothetical protein